MGGLEVVQGKVFDVIGVADAVIAQMAEKYMPLKINGIEDKEGLKKVHDARMTVKGKRIEVEKKRKDLKEDALRYGQAIDREANRIKGLLEPIEAHLAAEEGAVEAALEAIKQEAARKEAERVKQRIERLEAFGMGLRAGMYSILSINLPEALVKVCNDDQFEKFCSEIQAAIDAENKRLAAIAEEERKKRIQERLEADEREKKAAELRAEEKRIADERAEWERIKAEEVRAQEAAKQKIVDDERRAVELEKARQEAALKAVKEAEEKAKRDAQEKADREEKERIAAEKKAARAPDKVKIAAVADILDAIQTPDVKTDDGKAVALKVMMDIQRLTASIREMAGEL